jgi:hypothetical protein
MVNTMDGPLVVFAFFQRIVRPLRHASVIAAIVVGSAAASDPASSPITTDRPAVTASSIVVPSGSLQAENGFAETGS